MIKIEGSNPNNVLTDEKSYENIQLYNNSYKNSG